MERLLTIVVHPVRRVRIAAATITATLAEVQAASLARLAEVRALGNAVNATEPANAHYAKAKDIVSAGSATAQEYNVTVMASEIAIYAMAAVAWTAIIVTETENATSATAEEKSAAARAVEEETSHAQGAAEREHASAARLTEPSLASVVTAVATIRPTPHSRPRHTANTSVCARH